MNSLARSFIHSPRVIIPPSSQHAPTLRKPRAPALALPSLLPAQTSWAAGLSLSLRCSPGRLWKSPGACFPHSSLVPLEVSNSRLFSVIEPQVWAAACECPIPVAPRMKQQRRAPQRAGRERRPFGIVRGSPGEAASFPWVASSPAQAAGQKPGWGSSAAPGPLEGDLGGPACRGLRLPGAAAQHPG